MLGEGHRKSQSPETLLVRGGEVVTFLVPQQTEEARLERLHRYPGRCPPPAPYSALRATRSGASPSPRAGLWTLEARYTPRGRHHPAGTWNSGETARPPVPEKYFFSCGTHSKRRTPGKAARSDSTSCRRAEVTKE